MADLHWMIEVVEELQKSALGAGRPDIVQQLDATLTTLRTDIQTTEIAKPTTLAFGVSDGKITKMTLRSDGN